MGWFWLPSQNTWQVHIYISLPWGKLIIGILYWVCTWCQKLMVEVISHSTVSTSYGWSHFGDEKTKIQGGHESCLETSGCSMMKLALEPTYLIKLLPHGLLGKSVKRWIAMNHQRKHPGAVWWDGLRKRFCEGDKLLAPCERRKKEVLKPNAEREELPR